MVVSYKNTRLILLMAMIAFTAMPSFVNAADIAERERADMSCFVKSLNPAGNEDGVSLFQACHYAAELGAAGSQHLLSILYFSMDDTEQGMYWLEKAAQNGHTDAKEKWDAMQSDVHVSDTYVAPDAPVFDD